MRDCCYVLDLDSYMDLRLVHMMVMHYDYDMGNRLVQHLELWMDPQLVHMTVQRWDDQKAQLNELQMDTLKLCC